MILLLSSVGINLCRSNGGIWSTSFVVYSGIGTRNQVIGIIVWIFTATRRRNGRTAMPCCSSVGSVSRIVITTPETPNQVSSFAPLTLQMYWRWNSTKSGSMYLHHVKHALHHHHHQQHRSRTSANPDHHYHLSPMLMFHYWYSRGIILCPESGFNDYDDGISFRKGALHFVSLLLEPPEKQHWWMSALAAVVVSR